MIHKEDTANYGTWVGAVLAATGGLTLTDWLALGGFTIAVLGFLINWYYRHQMYVMARKKNEFD